MHLLVTRPEPDARALAERLRASGHAATIEPLMLVVPAPDLAALDLSNVQALLVTSRNAIHALAAAGRLADLLHLPLLAVGPGTAEAARAASFAHVLVGPAAAADLVAVARAALNPAAGALLHLSAEDVAFDLAGALQATGFIVRRVVVYRTEPRARLSEATQHLIAAGAIDAVILMSPRTAQAYADLVTRHGLAGCLGGMVHVCLSAAVASCLTSLGEVVKLVADRPNLEETLALLDRLAAQSRHSPDDKS